MYYLYCIARFLVLILPRKYSYFIASILSDIKFYISRKDRKAVIYNLKPIIKNNIKAIKYAKNVFNNFSFYMVDFFNLANIDRKFIDKYIKVTGMDNVNNLIQQKKGGIILSAHIGNYELGGAIAKWLGLDLYVVALPHKDKRVNVLFNYQRNIFNVKVISTGAQVKKCFKILKDRKMVAFLGDRDFTSARGEEVALCGRKALLPKGPAFFALKTGSFIIPCFFIREKKYFYRFIIERYISPRHDDGSLKNERELIQEYAGVLEKYIVRYPDQWYMFQKYWL